MATNSTDLLKDLVAKLDLNGTVPQTSAVGRKFLTVFREELMFTQALGSNYTQEASYEGIHIPVMDFEPTIHDYDILNGVAFEQYTYEFVHYPVTQHKAINVLYDDVENKNTTVNRTTVFSKLISECARFKAQEIELYNIAKATDATNGFPVMTDTARVTATNSYETVVAMNRVLRDAECNMSTVMGFVDGQFWDSLLLSNKTENIGSNTAYTDIWKYGRIDMVAGTMISEYHLLPTGVEAIFLDVNPDDPAMEFVMLFNKDLRLEKIANGTHIDAMHLVSRYIYESFVIFKEHGVVKTYV